MTTFSWLEFQEYWTNSSVEEHRTFLIWLGITIIVMLGIGIIDYIVRKNKKDKIEN